MYYGLAWFPMLALSLPFLDSRDEHYKNGHYQENDNTA
jgi:hypothetical protein